MAGRGDPGVPPKPPLLAGDVLVDDLITASPDVPIDQWKAWYLTKIANLKPGLTVILVHLGHDDSELQAVMVNHDGWGSAWRQRDYDVVNSAEFKKALKDNKVILVTWKQMQKLMQ